MQEHFLQKPSCAGVFHLPKAHAGAAVAVARQTGLKVLEADVGHFCDRDGVLGQLGRSWNFPDWYGVNLDALHDCLTDLDWQPASGYALLISGLGKLCAAHPDDFQSLIEVLRSAAEIRRENGTPLWVLLDATAPGIPTLPDA